MGLGRLGWGGWVGDVGGRLVSLLS
jgi:hypothetical protein